MTDLFSTVVPRGLGTPYVESVTSYLQRLANEHVVPPEKLFREKLLPAFRERNLLNASFSDLMRGDLQALNGAGDHARVAVACLTKQTGRKDLRDLAFLSLVRLQGISRRDLLARGKRWCSCCWRDDDATSGRYERNVWNLAVVEACPIHMTVLVERCLSCGRRQPDYSWDVRPGVCVPCGDELGGRPPLLDELEGSDDERRLWYARQAAQLIHCIDISSIQGLDAGAVAQARSQGLHALRAHLQRSGGPPAALSQVQRWIERWRTPGLEDIFSVLWRARWPVAGLFPDSVRRVLKSDGSRSRIG